MLTFTDDDGRSWVAWDVHEPLPGCCPGERTFAYPPHPMSTGRTFMAYAHGPHCRGVATADDPRPSCQRPPSGEGWRQFLEDTRVITRPLPSSLASWAPIDEATLRAQLARATPPPPVGPWTDPLGLAPHLALALADR